MRYIGSRIWKKYEVPIIVDHETVDVVRLDSIKLRGVSK